MKDKAAKVLALLFAAAGATNAQPTATCPAPGTSVTISGIGQCIGGCFVRVEQNPDGKSDPHKYELAVATLNLQQTGPVADISVTLPTTPGPWLAYYFQNTPYAQSKAVTFTCDAPIAPPIVTPPVVIPPPADQSGYCICQPPGCSCSMVLPRLIISVQSLDQQSNGTWRIHGDPPLTSLFLLISVNGLTAAEDEYSVEFAPGPKSVTGNPVIITALKPWSGKVEARWWAHYVGQ